MDRNRELLLIRLKLSPELRAVAIQKRYIDGRFVGHSSDSCGENSPAIIFIDEIDSITTKRFDAYTCADREVQRILLELLNQMDGFDQLRM
ncbi:hypothetical protein HK098_005115 [Nowakowskiella sp. JEL0407]|nr:hypothetical protein HK098_005115 [Nowakowskiella sp. JEL0407]